MVNEKEGIRKLNSADRQGQNSGFRLIHQMYHDELYRFVLQWVKSADTAEEIVHETFVKLWLHRATLDENRSVRAYLFTIARNSLIKELRRQMKNPLLRSYVEFVSSLGEEDRIAYDYDTFVNLLERAKESLQPRQVEIYKMCKDDEMSVREVAEKLSVTEQTVRNQLSRASGSIRDYLDKHLDDDYEGLAQ